ncbi:DEAD/DEAH box helicase [Acetitomaculum ruminis]|nr:SNF2 helicase associated domain-containing protein [Acetitomaculum ruminis]
MKLKVSSIKNNSSVQAFLNGSRLSDSGKIRDIVTQYDYVDELHVKAMIDGRNGNSYRTHVYINETDGTILDYQCNCKGSFYQEGMCKHCVALAMEFTDKEKLNDELPWQVGVKTKDIEVESEKEISNLIYRETIGKRAAFLQPAIEKNVELEATVSINKIFWYDEVEYALEFKIGVGNKKYVLKNIPEFIENVKNSAKFAYGAKLDFIHNKSAFTDEALKIIDFIMDNEKFLTTDNVKYRYSYGKKLTSKRYMVITKEKLGHFFAVLKEGHIAVSENENKPVDCYVVNENPRLEISIEKIENQRGFYITFPYGEVFGDEKQLTVLSEDTFFVCDKEYSENMSQILKLMKRDDKGSYVIGEKDMPAFVKNIIPKLDKYTLLDREEDLGEYVELEAELKTYLDIDDEKISCELKAFYGENEYNILPNMNLNQQISRDMEKEQTILKEALNYFEGDLDNKLKIDIEDEDAIYSLLTEGIDKLEKISEVYISEALKKIKVADSPKVKLGVSINAGLLDLKLDLGDFPVDELEGMLSYYKKKKKYYRLKNGDFLSIENNALARLSDISETFAIKDKDLKKGNFEIPRYRALYLEQLSNTDAFDYIDLESDKNYKALIRDIRTFNDSDFEIPKGLKDTLRNYQKTGYRWLRTLDKLGFGGILADDMGLGKSLQVISYISGLKEESGETKNFIIVCPASLVYNWEKEVLKFAKGLKTAMLVGNGRQRLEILKNYKDYDILITSYDLLKRDIEYYDMEFYGVIIDEAQNIKNHNTKAARAVKTLKAANRFALTGTPIENRLSELWSIFDFLMPGFLYSYTKFKKEYETPIVTNGDIDMSDRLKHLIKPFILRRLKEDVLKELPSKTEEIIYINLEGEQKKLYLANAKHLKERLGQKSKKDFNESKLEILAEITKLRQICCAPEILFDNYSKESTKVDACLELIQAAIDNGQKVLLFSQFTSIFNLLEGRLKSLKIDYFRLDGQTSKKDRIMLVDKFNEDNTPLFLISLKAGGTGLNLTGAGIVIHFDPWWNLAAQNQATDRAHRIGQTKPVTVYKLIAKNTIEEKIIKLQNSKKELSDQIIAEGGSIVSGLDKEDFEELLEVSEL